MSIVTKVLVRVLLKVKANIFLIIDTLFYYQLNRFMLKFVILRVQENDLCRFFVCNHE